MKLWQKDFTPDQRVEHFTVGRDREFDELLAPYDILGSLAHVAMLESIGLLSGAEGKQIREALRRQYEQARKGAFHIAGDIEDVHSQVEYLLTEELGDLGKKVHAGRSRNDQVLVDLRLYFRAEMEQLAEMAAALFDVLLALAEKHREVLLPGYTHTQVAMPSSFGLWFGSYAESLVDDLQQLLASFRIINHNPLGSAAGYGSSFPLDRGLTTRLLGFEDLSYNVVHAQMGRGKTELFLAFALAAFGATLNKLSYDLVLYLSQNFDFIRFPDELTTGSSIMPHKKNPDLFELSRAKCNQLLALPQQISILTTNLPSGYHRDFQLLKEAIFPAMETLKEVLGMLHYALPQIGVRQDILREKKYQYLFSVEAVNQEVLRGAPFRDAYRKIGQAIEAGRFTPPSAVQHTHEGSMGNLALNEIRRKWDTVWAGFGFERIRERLEDLLVSGSE